MRANEQGIASLVANVAVLAATSYSPGNTNASASYSALTQRVAVNLAGQQGTQTIQDIEADIANDGRLRPGAFVRADIVTQNARAILLPRNAIVTFAGIEKVFVYENGKAAERRVVTG